MQISLDALSKQTCKGLQAVLNTNLEKAPHVTPQLKPEMALSSFSCSSAHTPYGLEEIKDCSLKSLLLKYIYI